MSIYSMQPITLGTVGSYPLASRKSKVSVRDFAEPAGVNASLVKFLDSLPNILAAGDLRQLLGAIQIARKQRKAILWGIGGHVIKRRPWPLINYLNKKGFILGIFFDCAPPIHCFENAALGKNFLELETGNR